MIYGKYIIFDILGRYNELTFTNKYPFIAIEIVDTHFHSQESFKVLLELSKNLPIIILYYFVSKEPYLNSKKIHLEQIHIQRIEYIIIFLMVLFGLIMTELKILIIAIYYLKLLMNITILF